jgi:transposase
MASARRRFPACWGGPVRYDEVRYPSDLSDERWEMIRPVIEAWKSARPSLSGHQGRYEMREIVNAILYQARTGCQWRYLPRELPLYGAVYYFALWRLDRTDKQIHDLLRMQPREQAGRTEDPSEWCSTRSRCGQRPACRAQRPAWTRPRRHPSANVDWPWT